MRSFEKLTAEFRYFFKLKNELGMNDEKKAKLYFTVI